MEAVFRVFETPFAPFSVAFDSNGTLIMASGFTSKMEEIGELLPGLRMVRTGNGKVELASEAVQEYLECYFEGMPSATVTNLGPIPGGTDFQRTVWREINKIPFASTASYKQIADRIGRPNSFRATGTACGANKLALFIPCHRVVHASGTMGNYRWEARLKERLLRHEKSMSG